MAAEAFCLAEYALRNASVSAERIEEMVGAMTGSGRINVG